MKKVILFLVSLLNGVLLLGQNTPVDCSTDFWTINATGHIQQWSLQNGVVTGGDTVASGGGTSLSYCGSAAQPTFFSNSYNPLGIIRYSPGNGWINHPVPYAVDHGGGHLNNQYYRVEGAVIQLVKHWDGTNMTTVDSLNGEFFARVADIGVDTLGQAWVFTGVSLAQTDSLKVYNANGRVKAYAIKINQTAYGAFFLNDTLYIGVAQGSIYPVILNGANAQLGNPIPFPNQSFTDMASCQMKRKTNSIDEYTTGEIQLYPNPTQGVITLPLGMERQSVAVYNAQGQLVLQKTAERTLDLSEQPAGIYFVVLSLSNKTQRYKIMKE